MIIRYSNPDDLASLLDVPAGSYGFTINKVAVRGGQIVAFGTTVSDGQTVLTAWTSSDGDVWERHQLADLTPGSLASVTGLAATSTGFVAVGSDHAIDSANPGSGALNRLFLLRSDDGRRWEQIDVSAFSNPGTLIAGLATIGERLVAYGSTGGYDGTAAAWYSDDHGSTWSQAETPAAGALPYSGIVNATSTRDGLLLLGDNRTAEPFIEETSQGLVLRGDTDITAWVTKDGISYEVVDTGALNSHGHDMTTASGVGDVGVVIASLRVTADGSSPHLWSWAAKSGFAEQALDGGAGITAVITTLTSVEGGYLATGTGRPLTDRDLADPRGEDAQLWIIPTN